VTVICHTLQAALQGLQIRLADAESQRVENVLRHRHGAMCDALGLLCQRKTDDAPVLDTTPARQKAALLHHVQRVTDRAGVYVDNGSNVVAKYVRLNRQQHEDFGLDAGDVEFVFHALRREPLECGRRTHQRMSDVVVLIARYFAPNVGFLRGNSGAGCRGKRGRRGYTGYASTGSCSRHVVICRL
jgi:hypothetical protein